MRKDISPAAIAAGIVLALAVVIGIAFALSNRDSGIYTDKADGEQEKAGRGGRASAR